MGGPSKIWGPGINLRTPWKIFSLRPCAHMHELMESGRSWTNENRLMAHSWWRKRGWLLVRHANVRPQTLFSRLETDTRRKREEHWRKKVCSCSEGFFAVTRIQLISLNIFVEQVNRKKKSRWLDDSAYSRTINNEEKKTKLSVSNQLTKSLWSDRRTERLRITSCNRVQYTRF